MRKTITNIS